MYYLPLLRELIHFILLSIPLDKLQKKRNMKLKRRIQSWQLNQQQNQQQQNQQQQNQQQQNQKENKFLFP
jgi:hypothetical protein